MQDKKVIVTGEIRDFGSYLTERLLEDKGTTVLDNESTEKIENIKQLLGHKN
ncbi:hypothetical protein [Methanosarcina siciliae]|uniref:hypothetical protein n=1 Tax=Methanosarcina siciliae TaxID=38027 RepID=UPI000A7F4425|nr:hypothetical protein [Methanosarcina siciliae]